MRVHRLRSRRRSFQFHSSRIRSSSRRSARATVTTPGWSTGWSGTASTMIRAWSSPALTSHTKISSTSPTRTTSDELDCGKIHKIFNSNEVSNFLPFFRPGTEVRMWRHIQVHRRKYKTFQQEQLQASSPVTNGYTHDQNCNSYDSTSSATNSNSSNYDSCCGGSEDKE